MTAAFQAFLHNSEAHSISGKVFADAT